MSAPPLPEAFGNYALGEGFVEVVSPDAVNWLPQTPGWQVVGVIVAALAVHRAWRGLRRWYRNRYRREATARLRRLAQQPDSPLRPEEVNRLLKLTALAAFPREQVAALYGRAWVEFLNRQCPATAFDAEEAELLAEGPYRTAAVKGPARDRLLESSRTWIREHGNPRDD
jgi:hypothetical protein